MNRHADTLTRDRSLIELLDAWNRATDPRKYRTDHQHHRQAQHARALDNRIAREGWSYGIHWFIRNHNGTRYTTYYHGNTLRRDPREPDEV